MLARLLVFVVGAASFGGFPQLGGLQIRRAEVADLDSLADLRAEASPFATSYKVAAQVQATSASEERRLLRDTFCRGLDTGDAVCYVAVDRRSIVGYVDVTTRGALGPALAEHAYVKNLYILPEFRRRGLGERLVRACVGHAARSYASLETLALEVEDGNGAAERLYLRLGFTQTASLGELSALWKYGTFFWGRTLMYRANDGAS